MSVKEQKSPSPGIIVQGKELEKTTITLNLISLEHLKNKQPDMKTLSEPRMKRVHEFLIMAGKLDITYMNRNLNLINRDVQQLCSLGRGEELFSHLKASIIGYINVSFSEIIKEFDKKQSKDLIKTTQQFWLNHCLRSLKLQEAFQYLENYHYLSSHRQNDARMDIDSGAGHEEESGQTIWTIGVQNIKNHFTSQKGQKIILQLIDDILFQVQSARQAFLDHKDPEKQNITFVRDIVQMLLPLELYTSIFENKFIEKTATFYRAQSRELLKKIDIPQYVNIVLGIIVNEMKQLELYFDKQTTMMLTSTLESALIADHHKVILEKGFPVMVQQEMIQVLRLVYNFFCETNLVQTLRAFWSLYIRNYGKDLLKEIKDDQKMTLIFAMKKVIEFKHLTDKLIIDCFQNKEEFKQSQREGFEGLLNVEFSPDKSSHFLAVFIDKMMMKENPSSKSKQIIKDIKSTRPELIVSLFRYLAAKDTFENYYTKYLSHRLLQRKTESWDNEQQFVGLLKMECGHQFTQRVEQMFVDITTSEQLMKEFVDQKKSKNQQVEMEYFILSSGSWPISQKQSIIKLPKQIQDASQGFIDYYRKSYSGRVLSWSIDHCTSLMKGTFENGKASYQFETSGIQALILLQFNNSKTVTLQLVKNDTQLLDEQIKVGLQSLSIDQHSILIREVKSIEPITKDDVFLINESFTSKLKRLNINKIPKNEKKLKEEEKETEERVKEDRRYQIDAIVMKIMKEKKTIPHNDLLTDIFSKINFPIDNTFIKSRIESLIEKDYIKRNPTNAAVYDYIA